MPAAVEGELAGRGERLAAALLDMIIAVAILLPLMFFGGYFSAILASSAEGRMFAPVGLQVTWAAIGFVVFVLVQAWPLHRGGQTWGKRVVGIRIVTLDGDKPSLATLFGKRYFPLHLFSNIPLVGSLYALVDTLMIFRDDRRCLHDLLAGTRVVTARG